MGWGAPIEVWGLRPRWGVESDYSTENFALNFPRPRIVLYSGGEFLLEFRRPQIVLTGNDRQEGTFALRLPFPVIDLYSYPLSDGSFAFNPPRRVFVLTGASDGQGDFAFTVPPYNIFLQTNNPKVLVLNTENWAGPVEYTNFSFNSLCQFGDDLYLANSSGMFKQTGSDDNGSNIAAYVIIPENDFGDFSMKSLEEIIVGLKTGGITVQTFHDTTYSTAYTILSTSNEVKNKRAKVGRGLRQRYWGIRIDNVTGSTFTIDQISLVLSAIKRRINQ